jgi:hypothetical protein
LLYLNNDSKKFDQYKQSKQSPVTLNERTQKKKKITTFPVGNQSTGFGRANKWGGVKLVDTLIYNNT